VIVDVRGRPWLVDFGFAEAGADGSQLDADIAQLLASLAAVVGPHRAVRSALTALEPARLARCLSQLQPAALPAATRTSLRPQPHLLAELRTGVAEATGTTLTALPPLTRVRWRTLALLLVLGVGVHGLLPQLDQAGRALTLLPTAVPGWVLATVAWSAFSYAFASLALVVASPRRLPFGRTAAVQVAGSFANRLAPAGLGGLSLNVRYLQRAGLGRVEAASTLTVNTAAGLLVHVLALLGAAGWVARTGLGQVRLPHRWPVLVAVVLILAGTGCVMFLPRIRRQLLPALRSIAAQASEIVRAPSRAAGLLTSNAGITLCYALSLDASVHAYRVHVQFARVAAVYLAALAVATASPTPGGLGAVEAALTAGLTAVHIPFTQALAGVLTFRLATYWLPILPGLVTYRILRRTETL
jgi:glycosyltransferase 2 family protein